MVFSRLAILTLLLGTFCCMAGCISTGEASKLAQQTAAPGWEMAQAGNLTFCVGIFQRKLNRWPTNFTELSKFVEGSNGYLALDRKYSDVQFETLAANGLSIRYTVAGVGHHILFQPTEVASAK